MTIYKASDLLLNSDGSVFHLKLHPNQVAPNIILVGDPDRAEMVSSFFSSLDYRVQNREFVCHTGMYQTMPISVISSGIGTDNIDIVLNELDALVNIDLNSRTIKKDHTCLQIVRMGTSGSLQKNIPVDSIVLGKYGLGFDGLLHFYRAKDIMETEMEDAFVAHCQYPDERARPYIVKNSDELERKLISDEIFAGITATSGGFYGPQGRVLRLAVQDKEMNRKIESFRFNKLCITNLEMETSAIYGLSKLMGHKALSMNAIIANRSTLSFSKDPYAAVEKLIKYTLNKLSE